MRFSLGRVLISGGLAVAVFGAVAVALGLHAALPPDVLKIAAYKLVGIAALGLIVAGAALRRMELERRADTPPDAQRPAELQAELPAEGRALPPADARLERTRPRSAREPSYVAEGRRQRRGGSGRFDPGA